MKTKKSTKREPLATSIISNNVLTGVHWDGKAIEAVNNVSKALLNLTELFKSQNITIEPMISINNNKIM